MTTSSTLFPKIEPFSKGFYSEVNHSYADNLCKISSHKKADQKKVA